MNAEYKLYRMHEFTQANVMLMCEIVKPVNTVVEIGVHTGHFTFNMLHVMAPNNPMDTHYAIDPFEENHEFDNHEIQSAFKDFEHNRAITPYASNLTFMRQHSWQALSQLLQQGVQADLIYVDGDHRSQSVLEDLVLGFRLLRVGGAILCDDSVNWGNARRKTPLALQQTPRIAVDAFIHCNWDRIDVVNLINGYQSAFVKTRT